MKNSRIEIKTDEMDQKLIEKAALKFEKETGKKGMVSRTLIHSVKAYAESEPELFFCNRIAIEQTETNIEYGRKHLQNVLTEYITVTGQSTTITEMQKWFGGIHPTASMFFLWVIGYNFGSKRI
ncbi:MAG: hypothetical protein Q8S54_05150 [Bacteroidota bacterium]|nr:hypothetical protein [Bacteroidota bacterium]